MTPPPLEISPLQPQVLVVPLSAPLQWLRLGWRDLRRCGPLSLAHGVLLAAFGLALLANAYQHFWLLAGAFSGFLVVAPVLATSLYAMSRAVEHDRSIGWSLLRDTWLSWQQSRFMESGGYWCLVRFGLLLALAGTGWVVTSAALITLLAPVPINAPADFLRYVVLSRDNLLFETWLAMGGVLAAPIFASSIVAMPLLLDRRSNLLMAVLTSWRVVLANPGPMAVWAALIMLLVLISFATAMLGLILLIPVLGHASWHAYRALVDASALPERPRAQ
ncbi:MAG: DUF2189 domain-containing protein [Candidatus Accumulibacter meliphilus]|jgi:uncharacterized membrane protein|uniref:DUF2189 domain-containing protein n=1 Tax=Candidatus Accumulibacter meliphilus TaxID=2211374 RepID=A0A369XS67_9PROT|nr:MAG: DUF2189 domain-containing protein [Candidatus Accumulibacter meliphilus]